jgi:hypothetical protein
MRAATSTLLCAMLGLVGSAGSAAGATVGGEDPLARFEIKPDVPGTVRASINGHTCVFSYAAAGGTGEQFELTAARAGGRRSHQVACQVRRPHGSYLVFSRWSMNLIPAGVGSSDEHPSPVSMNVRDNDGVLEIHEAWTAERSLVRNADGWMGTVSNIAITYALPK